MHLKNTRLSGKREVVDTAADASVSTREMRFQTGTIIISACGIVGTLAEEARITTEHAEGKAESVVFLGLTSRPEANTTTVS